eukprot:7938515-Alexandrium_andersonii.AAC.1
MDGQWFNHVPSLHETKEVRRRLGLNPLVEYLREMERQAPVGGDGVPAPTPPPAHGGNSTPPIPSTK